VVVYQIHAEMGKVVICHCQPCRKANGSAYAVNAPIKRADFKLLKGEISLKEFSSSSGVNRVFCGDCGALIYSKRDNDSMHYRLRLGTLDTPLSHGPSLHVCVASKAEWKMICDG
jgi:hypothetical protein